MQWVVDGWEAFVVVTSYYHSTWLVGYVIMWIVSFACWEGLLSMLLPRIAGVSAASLSVILLDVSINTFT